MKIGYIMESHYCKLSYDQQKKDLEQWGCNKLYGDRIHRYNNVKNFFKIFDQIQDGDTFVICSKEVLGVSYSSKMFIEKLEKKNVIIEIAKTGESYNPWKLSKFQDRKIKNG